MNIDTLDWPGTNSDGQRLDETRKNISSQPQPISADPQVTEVLQNLVKVNRDGEKGFQYAAQHVHDRGLRDEFQKFARERRSMTAELFSLMPDRAGPSGSVTAALHRTWMGFRTTLSEEPDDQTILDEVERGENAAEEAYQSVLKTTSELPLNARPMVMSLAQKVHRAHERVRNLRDSGIYKHTSR